MSVITLNVNEANRTLAASDAAVFVVNDKNVDIVRFALLTGFTDIALDEHSALRVMYQRPREGQVRAKTLTFNSTDGLHDYYDWELLAEDLAENGTITCALCILRTDSELEEWHTTPCQISVLNTIHTDDSDEADETITPTVAERVAVLESMIQRVASGAPIVVANASAMTDTDQIYVLSTNGKWYYHNGSAWVVGGVYGGVPTDTTLTQAGMAADAEATGNAINVSREDVEKINSTAEKLYAWAQDGGSPFVVYDNSYINNMGQIRSYKGWSRTDYINVENATKVLVISTKNSTYNKFYDENKNGISAYDGNLTINIVTGENVVDVPANAKYMILSGEGTYANDVAVYVYQDRTQKEISVITETYKKNALGKYYLILQPSDFENGKRIVSGEEATDAKYALSGYIKLLNTQNKYIFNMSAENGIYISQYELQEDGTFKFISKSSYITNGGEYWATTGVTHIRIEFYSTTDVTNNTSVIFCDAFSMEESNDINKYIRVCTFNQAADYPHFTRATEEDLNKRILNYLNFIGEYNPDVICAQEAVETYFQPVSFEKSTSAVFNRKYLFPWDSGHQRKTWSKYNYGRKGTVQFTAQVEGGTRFYSKQTLYYENKEIVILNAHCEYRGESDFELVRKAQFEELATEMAQHNYCICCGDFNAWSASEFNVFKDAGFTCANCGDYGVIDTWYVGTDYPDWPFKAVDNIIITPNIVIQNVERGPYDFDYFSDHAPLIADLQIR